MTLFSKINLKSSKIIIIVITIIIIILFLAWLFIESSKPLPGTKIADLGRGHVSIGENVDYNSYPPTSGKHYEEWVRSGVYEIEKDDRNLVHSLEHGYIIMYYKCPEQLGKTQSVSESGIPDNRNSGTPSSSESSETCTQRRGQLAKVYEKKGRKKLIVVARPNLETNFAITAWTYLDKFDVFDESRIEKFIDAHIDQGPEKTME